jgi:hypothetical protein
MSNKQTPESFWARVDRDTKGGCWEWQGSVNSTGYGTVGWHGTNYTAHRVAAWLLGLVSTPKAPLNSREPTHVLHKCDNRRCCNPDHFFLGTFTDNMKDAYTKRRKTQPRGQYHANAKLTNEQVAEIRKRYKAGELQVPLASEYGVSQRAISLIVRGETYTCQP